MFTDKDITQNPEQLDSALDGADVVFGSLIFDFEEVNWLRDRLSKIPTRFIFESALELMSSTQVGSFSMASEPGKKQGMPPAVKSLLSKFSSTREEDRLDSYTKFLKAGPSLLKFIPVDKAQDLRKWLQTYSYWNAGGVENVAAMFCTLASDFGGLEAEFAPAPQKDTPFWETLLKAFKQLLGLEEPEQAQEGSAPAVVEVPQRGLVHPDRPGYYFESPREYLAWYRQHKPESKDWPTVGVLLYRKHVISELAYIPELTRHMEDQKLTPLPLFITGVDGHIAVRDSLTSPFETEAVKRGDMPANPTLSPDAVNVDAVVSTIGFPLVGGPAGSMEGARQAELAQEILLSKNVPYFVAAPLLIQDIKSWYQTGIGGLQSVVLYALPELDGAIDAIALGGLCCGDKEFCNANRDLQACNREGGEIRLVKERLLKLTDRIKRWTALRTNANKDKRIAVVLYGYPPGIGATGTAALLNVPKSLMALLTRMKAEGYDVGELPEDPEDLMTLVRLADEQADNGQAFRNDNYASSGGGSVSVEQLEEWIGRADTKRVESNWGGRLDRSGIRTMGSGDKAQLLLGGVRFGNVWVGVQPPLGLPGDPMRLLFERDMTPHPQYAAFYKFLERAPDDGGFGADCFVHFGMHGTAEWLPGTPLGNTGECWPDIMTGGLPNVYVYAANNPSESLLAKRRGYGTLVSHNVPPYSRAGLYKELQAMRGLLADYFESAGRSGASDDADEAASGFATKSGQTTTGGIGASGSGAVQAVDAAAMEKMEGAPTTEGALLQTLFAAGLEQDCPLPAAAMAALEAAGGLDEGEKAVEAAAAQMVKDGVMMEYCEGLKGYLAELEQRLFSAGLHVFGSAPGQQDLESYLTAYFEDGSWEQEGRSKTVDDDNEIRTLDIAETDDNVKKALPFPETVLAKIVNGDKEASVLGFRGAGVPSVGTEMWDRYAKAIREACSIRDLLSRNTEEVDGVLRALKGEFVAPAPGGDLLRDGSGVLPTGRNIHALDPYRVPSKVAMARGKAAAELTLQMHQRDNAGELPETVAVNLWGLEAIKTKGESVAVVLGLIGAQPVVEATGRVVRFELIPLEKLGRPRVDVLASLSGIFRDSFANVIELLDDVLKRAADADEPVEMNFIKKHALELRAAGEDMDASTARIFSNPPGEFGSLVNERVTDSSWEEETDLGDTWAKRNAFSFGKGGRGVERRATLDALMKTTGQVVQCIDSVEYGLTDIQEYYANTGAMVRAMDDLQGGEGKVNAAIIESYSRAPRPKKLNDVLRLEYRSKLLNPKWANTMVDQGSGGAFEVSQRMTALIGWGATTKFKENWVYDQSADTYALDPEMAQKLRDSNPEAFKNIVGRLLEASRRGMWDADKDKIDELLGLYEDIDDQMELGSASKYISQSIESLDTKK